MDNVELKTPKGYTVLIKPELTYGEYLQIQEIYTSKMTVDSTGAVKEIPGSVVNEASKKSLEILVVSVRDANGNELPDKIQAIYNMPMADAKIITDKINEITSSALTPEKKD